MVFVCTSWVVRWRGMNINWVVVGESTSVLGGRQKGVLCGSCLMRVTSMHCIKSIRVFEDDVR